jgi:5'-3' exonuclease
MGIQGLLPVLKKEVPEAFKIVTLRSYSGQTLAIDIRAWIYRFLYGDPTSTLYLTRFHFFLQKIDLLNIKLIVVNDGVAPKEKALTAEKRLKDKRRTKENTQSMIAILEETKTQTAADLEEEPTDMQVDGKEDIDPFDRPSSSTTTLSCRIIQSAIDQRKKGEIHVTKDMMENTEKLFQLWGHRVIHSVDEGEALCSLLDRLNYVTGVLSEDSDVLAFGGRKLIRNVPKGAIIENFDEGEMYFEEITVQTILDKIGLNLDEFIELALLCGTDFTGDAHIKGVGAKNALKEIQKYKNVQTVMENLSPKLKSSNSSLTAEAFDPARQIFYGYSKATCLPEHLQYDKTETLTKLETYLIEEWMVQEIGVSPENLLPKRTEVDCMETEV